MFEGGFAKILFSVLLTNTPYLQQTLVQGQTFFEEGSRMPLSEDGETAMSCGVVGCRGDENSWNITVDVAGDEGCLMVFTVPASFLPVEERKTAEEDLARVAQEDELLATVKYVGKFAESGNVFDESPPGRGFSFVLGRGDVIKGLDLAVRKLRVPPVESQVGRSGGGNIFPFHKAIVTLRHDYAYGENGLPDKVPPFSKLVFALELLSLQSQGGAQEEKQNTSLPALPAPLKAEVDGDAAVNSAMAASEARTLTVGGEPLRLDALGPIILNSDGTTSRIANWHAMTESERETTKRLIAKRNQKRAAELAAADNANSDGSAPLQLPS